MPAVTRYRLPFAADPIPCDHQGCWRMATLGFVKKEKDVTIRKNVCDEHARPIAARYGMGVEA